MRKSSKPTRRKPIWQRRQRVLLLSTLGILFVLVLPIASVHLYGQWQINRLDAQLRAQGIPVTKEEYEQARPKLPDDKNGASHYEQAMGKIRRALLKPAEEIEKQIAAVSLAAPFSNDLKNDIERWLAEYAETLALLHQAAQYPACDFGLPPEYCSLPFLGILRQGVRLLLVEAMLAAQEGDTQKTMESLTAAFAASRSVQSDPHFSAHVERIYINRITLDALQRILSSASFSDAQLLQLQTTLRALNDPVHLTNALIGERIILLSHYKTAARVIRDHADRMDQDIVNAIPGKTSTLIYAANFSGWNRLDQIWTMRIMNEMIDASRLPYPKLLDVKNAIRRKAGQKGGFMPRISDVFLPELSYNCRLFAEDTAYLRLAETALAAERYRLANGRLPQQLTDLTPMFIDAVPQDPFDGAPLRYQTLENGFAVYSVYHNGNDDGGNPAAPSSENQKGDLPFRVEHARSTLL